MSAKAEKAARWFTAKIRELEEDRDTYKDLVGCMVHPDLCDQLQAENEKLRKLVYDLLRPKYDSSIRMTTDEWNARAADILRRANELGIEVD